MEKNENRQKLLKEKKRHNASSVSNYNYSVTNTSRGKYSLNNRVC